MSRPEFIVPIDIGQAADFTALGGLRRVRRPTGKSREVSSGGGLELEREYEDVLHLGKAKRYPLHTPYPEIVGDLAESCAKIPGTYQVVADATGVGRPVVDMMRAHGLNVIGVIITGGAGQAHQDQESGYWKVPKRELVTRAQTYLQTGRLRISSKLPLADVIIKEMLSFKMKISTATGNVSFEAWRDAIHDDLVLMLCMGVWWADKTKTGWKKDSGPHKDLDHKFRDNARKHFAEQMLVEEPEWV